MLDAALAYVEYGVPVFPVWWVDDGQCACGEPCGRDAGKHPLGPAAPHGFKDASRDPANVEAWWRRFPRAHIGTPTSWCAVLDIDPRHDGDLTLKDLEAKHGVLPETAEVLSGGGGRHVFFRPVAGLKSSIGIVGLGLDVKAEGGYVLLPPSGHVSGGVYTDEIEHPLFETTLAPMPAWLLARARADGREHSNGTAPPLEDIIPAGQRNSTLASLAGTMRRRGMQPAEIAVALAEVNRNRCRPPLPDDEVEAIARSVGRYAPADEGPAKEAAADEPTAAGSITSATIAEKQRTSTLFVNRRAA